MSVLVNGLLSPGGAIAASSQFKQVTSKAAPRLDDPTRTNNAAPAKRRSRVRFGAYVPGAQHDPARLAEFEELVGARADVASFYYGYGDVFPGPLERAVADQGRRDVLLSWDMGPTTFRQWANGRHDRYLKKIAAAASRYPHRIYVRPWPEMNGDWTTFQPTANGVRAKRYGGTYAQFVAAWRHVVKFTRARGATNIRWVFNPTADTYSATTPVAKIWPGRRYVDVLGMDGFNWGRDSGWGRWRSFSAIFATQYRRLTALDPKMPVWICEFASKEPSTDDGAPVDRRHSKGAWIRGAFSAQQMPRIRARIYFHEEKERDWRVNSSTAALTALRNVLAR